MTASRHDGYPLLIDIDGAIEVLQDEISGATEDRGRDTRISAVIRLLEHLRLEVNYEHEQT